MDDRLKALIAKLPRYVVGAVEHHGCCGDFYATTEVEQDPDGNYVKWDELEALLALRSGGASSPPPDAAVRAAYCVLCEYFDGETFDADDRARVEDALRAVFRAGESAGVPARAPETPAAPEGEPAPASPDLLASAMALVNRVVHFDDRKQQWYCTICCYRDFLGPDGTKLHADDCPVYKLHDACDQARLAGGAAPTVTCPSCGDLNDASLFECGSCRADMQSAKAGGAAQAPSGPAWQPIKTAPKDGSQVLVVLRDDAMCRSWQYQDKEPVYVGIAYWTEHNGGGWVSFFPGNPTHWMPLPAAPSGDQEPPRATPAAAVSPSRETPTGDK